MELAKYTILRQPRGNKEYGREQRFSVKNLMSSMRRYDPDLNIVVADDQKLRRVIKQAERVFSSWIRGGLPETASVKDPGNLPKLQDDYAQRKVKGTSLTKLCYRMAPLIIPTTTYQLIPHCHCCLK